MSPGKGMEIVLHAARNEGSIPEAPEEPFAPLSSSPRRTQKLRFTCDRCKEKTEAMVNPNALETGTVFVQCSHCLVHHTLVDNLNLLNDMESPNFVGDSKTFYSRGGSDSWKADLESLYNMDAFGDWDASEDVSN